jgi:hypothetical protein
VGGAGEDLELLSGEVAAEQAEAAVRRGEQAMRIDVVERGLEPIAHLVQLLDPAAGDRDHALIVFDAIQVQVLGIDQQRDHLLDRRGSSA